MKQKKSSKIIDPNQFGISFSYKQCQAFNLNQQKALRWLLDQGFRRFRLMSYWNEHEKSPGEYEFSILDEQVQMIAKAGGEISLCLGARQPRWPENHWPEWVLKESKFERSKALYNYLVTVVDRYKNEEAIKSYQLENEALLKKFGRNPEVDRHRLFVEYRVIKRVDKTRPIIMTTSNGWGVPIIGPIPDAVGFSYYTVMYRKGRYNQTVQKPWLHRLRKQFINLFWRKPVFIHELQCEPWGPTAIWKMDIAEQDKSMNPEQIQQNIALAKSIVAAPIDLWGAEWWYWRLTRHKDPTIWQAVRLAIEP